MILNLQNEGKYMLSTTQKINQLIASPVKKKKRTLLEEKHPEENRKNSGGLPNESFQSKMFRKDDVPIAYKENFIDGNPRETDVTYKIIKKREQALYQEDTKSRMIRRSSRVHEVKKYDGLSLEKSPEGKWFIKDNMNNQLFEPEADMSYIFVTMPNDTIRISTRGKHGHVSLSGFARYVKYAGEVTFDKYQRITSWNNASYSYIPPPFLAFQANFQEDTRRFHKVVDRNDPVLQVSPIFSRIQKK
jgi:hypothetical protein